MGSRFCFSTTNICVLISSSFEKDEFRCHDTNSSELSRSPAKERSAVECIREVFRETRRQGFLAMNKTLTGNAEL